MKTTRSATSRAKPISWVTTIIVMPPLGEVAHDLEHLADQLGVERARRLVEEHQLGVHRQGPGDGDALLLATGELGGVGRRLVAQARPARAARGRARRGLLLLDALDLHRRLDDVLEHRHVREEVEPLEAHADVAALGGDPLVGEAVQRAAAVLVAHQVAVDPDPAAVDGLELVDAAQERRLARPGGAEQHDDLAAAHVHVDALEHLGAVEGLGDVDGVDERAWPSSVVAVLGSLISGQPRSR